MTGPDSPSAREIAALFHRLEPLGLAERRLILERECSGRPRLQKEVEELLASVKDGEAIFGEQPPELAGAFEVLRGNLPEGARIGPYCVEGHLPGGGMATVVRARDERSGAIVALKVMSPEIAGDSQWQRRFAREAETLRSLNHPAIVKLYEVGEDQGLCYFTMELIEGQNLRQRMDAHPPSLDEALQWTRGILQGLQVAHSAGFSHGDLKPENIMLDKHGHIRLLDFGLTRAFGANIPVTQTASSVIGTVQYMSPERIVGKELDGRSDLFSVGVLLFEFLSGAAPFSRPNPLAAAAAILHEAPTPLGKDVPAPVRAVVRRCLEKEPSKRFPSAQAVAHALSARTSLPLSKVVPVGLVLLGAVAAAWLLRPQVLAPLQRVSVPGAADIWLAGRPPGTKVSGRFGTDSVPANAPVRVSVIPEHRIAFQATGSVSVDQICFAPNPNGGCYMDESAFGTGPFGGISAYLGPASALVGVFTSAKALPSAPPPPIDFRQRAKYPQLIPKLGQIFLVGDGSLGHGVPEEFIVPAGATDLYLAPADSIGSANGNLGGFSVTVRDVGPRAWWSSI